MPKLFNRFSKDPVKDNCNDVGIVPDVHQLISGVAIVGIDWCKSGFESGEQTFKILRTVVHVLRNFVLLLNAGIEKTLSDSVCTLVEISPGIDVIVILLSKCIGESFGY